MKKFIAIIVSIIFVLNCVVFANAQPLTQLTELPTEPPDIIAAASTTETATPRATATPMATATPSPENTSFPTVSPAPTPASISIDVEIYTAFFYNYKLFIEWEKSLTTTANKKAYWAVKKNIDELKSTSLKITRELMLTKEKAVKNGYVLTAAEIKKVDDDYTSILLRMYGTLEKVEAECQKLYHVSFDVIKRMNVDQAFVNNYKVKGSVKLAKNITDLEAKNYFKKNAYKFKKVKVRHILFKTTNDSGAPLSKTKIAEQKKKANSILTRIKKGESMEKLALKYSQDTPAVKQNKGVCEVAYDSQFVKEFKDWAWKNKVKALGIVKTLYGYHVMRVESITGVVFDKIKAQIKKVMSVAKFDSNLKYFLANAPTLISNQTELDKIVP